MAEKKPDGWFSRRHETREAHDRASAHHTTKADRQVYAANRRFKRDQLTNTDQLQILDSRLGAGVGARRERARLAGR